MALLMKVLFRWQVEGLERFPASGPVLVCANHTSYWDPPMVGVALPRPVHFMAKEELFGIPVFRTWLRAVGAFPVRRGTADLSSFRQALTLLKEGKVVGIFPEGTRNRSGKLLPAHPGAAYLAVSSGAPVVPVAICGRYRPFSRIRVRVGTPLDLRQFRTDKRKKGPEMASMASEVIMSKIEDLLTCASDEVKGGWK